MTSRLIVFILFPCLIIALLLSFVGVQQIEFGDTYYNFMKSVSRAYSNWSFSIPNIPKIPQLNDSDFNTSGLILTVLIKIGKAIISFFNAIVSLINVLVLIVNVVIQLIQFCLTLIYCLLGFRDSFVTSVFI